MPDYGVETAEWSPLPWSWAAERLARNRNYWVVTASSSARPHALPVWGVWDDDEHRFAFSCGPRARKAANLRDNPYVVFTVDDTTECLSVEGRARFVAADDSRLDVWIERYLDKYRTMAAELSAEFLRENLVVEVEPEKAFAIIEREDDFARRATRWVFDD
jgi:nitroimidazol reductase NimA-like FMN-containing flavoprotein (pyridoxamine 5'-phosphate oxidase superfamily)